MDVESRSDVQTFDKQPGGEGRFLSPLTTVQRLFSFFVMVQLFPESPGFRTLREALFPLPSAMASSACGMCRKS